MTKNVVKYIKALMGGSRSGTCCTCGKKIDYGKMYCDKCRPK